MEQYNLRSRKWSRPAFICAQVTSCFLLCLVTASCSPKNASTSLAVTTEKHSLETWIRTGEALRQQGEKDVSNNAVSKYEGAALAFRNALKLDPLSEEAAYGLASVFMRLGRTEDAVSAIIPLLGATAENAKLYARLGYAARYAGYLDESIFLYKKSAELNPSSSNQISSQEQIAKAFIYAGNYGKALEFFPKIRVLYEREGKPVREKTAFYEGLTHLYLSDKVQARALLDEAVHEGDGTLWAQFALGYRLLMDENILELKPLSEKIELGNVSDGERRYRLVHFFTALGDHEKALSHLGGAIDAGNFNFLYISNDPLLDPLRAEPDFERILHRAKTRHDAIEPLIQKTL